MCVLKQMKNGFSADGNPLSGLVKAESYKNELTCEVSLINFAPLSEGNYCLVITDRKGEIYSFPLRHDGGRSEGESKIDLSGGFLCVVCYADFREYHAIAYGVNGENVYEIGSLLFKLFTLKKNTVVKQVEQKDVYNNKDKEFALSEPIEEKKSEQTNEPEEYHDEAVATEDYYHFTPEEGTQDNLLSTSVLRAFKICSGDTYYQSVRSELDEIFNANPRDESLKRVFPHSLWVKIESGEEKGNLVGVILEKMAVRYVCFAKRKKEGELPPPNACFVPVNVFDENGEGYFVTFRDADSGVYANIQNN